MLRDLRIPRATEALQAELAKANLAVWMDHETKLRDRLIKGLMEKMSKKAQASRMTVSQHIEGEKLQNSMEDLNRQGTVLRAQLDGLRTQMIDLDKRKSRLEMMIQQSP